MLPKLRLRLLGPMIVLPFPILSMIIEPEGTIVVAKQSMPHVLCAIVSSDDERLHENVGNRSDSAHPRRSSRRHDVGGDAAGVGVGEYDAWVSFMVGLVR